MEIPSSVTTIEGSAFAYCASLSSIYLPSSVTTLGAPNSTECPNLTTYCGASSKPTNWNANWNKDNAPVSWNVTYDQYLEAVGQ